MNDLNKNLEILGLETREIKVYTFLLSNKDVPAYAIASGTQIPRSTVYKILDSLQSQGLVSKWTKNSVKHFSAENPNKLQNIIAMKKEAVDNAMPLLTSLFTKDSIYPSTKLYIGKDGVKHVFEMLLTKIKDEKIKRIYVYSDYLLTERFPKYFDDWRQRKNKTGSYTQLIVPFGTPMTDDYSSNEFRETRVMPEKFSFLGSLDICGSLCSFFSFKDKEVYSIVIDSPIVAEMLTKIFQYMWETLDKKST